MLIAACFALVYGSCSRCSSTSSRCQVPNMLSTKLQLHTQCELFLCIAGGLCRSVAQCSVVRPLLALCPAAAAATDAHVYNRHRSCCQVQSVCAFANDITPYIASKPMLQQLVCLLPQILHQRIWQIVNQQRKSFDVLLCPSG